MIDEVEIEMRAMRETVVTQQRELERLREENGRMQKRVSVLDETIAFELEERKKLIAIIARAQSMKVTPEHEWPKFPENTLVRVLSTNAPAGMIDLAVVEGDTADVIAKRLVDVVTTAMRTKKATVER